MRWMGGDASPAPLGLHDAPLYRWGAAIAERQEVMAQAVTREVGKPIGEARGEVSRCVAILRYYAGECVREIGEVIPAQAPGALQFTVREPLGVVALITPWNFPVAIPMWKVGPALAFGNTVVLKPAESSSHAATLLAEAALAAGLPPGVFNVVPGAGSHIGAPLINHPLVRAVSFTGSGKVGAMVAALATARNIRYQTEMGGKNIAIVLADADLKKAAVLTAGGAMRYAGQKCTATSRVVVDQKVEGAFLDELRTAIEMLPIGPVTDPKSAIGPLISEHSRSSIRKILDGAGAETFYAGAVPSGEGYDRGFFMGPTVVRGVAPDSVLGQQELFGPVLTSFSSTDLDHAIALANGTSYGLSASLFTRDLPSALHYIERIHVGLVRVNGDTTGVDPHAPFGGVKGSRLGTREQGRAARDFYTETSKTVQTGSMSDVVGTGHRATMSMDVIDSHTEGEPTRVVVGGWPVMSGTTMAERRDEMRDRLDHLRRAVVCEPRGHAAIVGAVIMAPVSPGATAGIVFFNNETYLGMCGHGLIGVVRTLQYLERLSPGTATFDTPAGTVVTELDEAGKVTIQNVPAYAHALDVAVDVPGEGRVVGDVAYGGNWFFITHLDRLPVTMKNGRRAGRA